MKGIYFVSSLGQKCLCHKHLFFVNVSFCFSGVSKYLVEFLGHIVGVCFTLQEIAKLLSRVLYHFACHSAVHACSSWFASCLVISTLCMVSIFYVSHSNRHAVMSQCGINVHCFSGRQCWASYLSFLYPLR